MRRFDVDRAGAEGIVATATAQAVLLQVDEKRPPQRSGYALTPPAA